MRVRVDESGHNGRVAEVEVGGADAVRFDGGDLIAVHDHYAAFQRRPSAGNTQRAVRVQDAGDDCSMRVMLAEPRP